jgi:hypothetical protein
MMATEFSGMRFMNSARCGLCIGHSPQKAMKSSVPGL